MIVKAIRKRHVPNRKLVSVTFDVSEEVWEEMCQHAAAARCHVDTLDYVAGHINTAFLKDIPDRKPGEPSIFDECYDDE